MDLRATVKAQLLAFLLYSSLASLQLLAAAFGGAAGDESHASSEEEAPEREVLPGPYAALRCLFWLDPGKFNP